MQILAVITVRIADSVQAYIRKMHRGGESHPDNWRSHLDERVVLLHCQHAGYVVAMAG